MIRVKVHASGGQCFPLPGGVSSTNQAKCLVR